MIASVVEQTQSVARSRCHCLPGLQFPNNTLVLSSGDNYVSGPRFFAAGDESNAPVLGAPGNGRRDIAFLNAMGFQASALGNHELNRGTGVFASIIAAETGAEQEALAEYLAQFFAQAPFGQAETSTPEDWRIQNLGIAGKRDTVFEPSADH